MSETLESAAREAAALLCDADALLVTAGAGLGVDSGLPDFRGKHGFWKAYPALGRARLEFTEIATPRRFESDPALAWGFYGHRLALYRATVPHPGFALLRTWMAARPRGGFVYTSNVDGQFQRAGFDPGRIVEVHGSIHHLQCRRGCADAIWPADGFVPEVDAERCLLMNEPPHCPSCGAVARPNILMFDDGGWVRHRSQRQVDALHAWLRGLGGARPLVIEIGAGQHVPTVRMFGEDVAGALVRINPTDAELPPGTRGVALACGGLEGLTAIAAELSA
jgi:NAD-dependent SIR2 family protein deacetylase